VAAKRGKFKQIIDPILAKALTHKVRGATLLAFGERGVASPKEVADDFEMDLTEISYHVRKLKAQGLIRLIRTEKRRGFHEHFYELTKPVLHLDDRVWKQLPKAIRDRFSDSLLEGLLADAVEALKAGTFNEAECHQSQMAMPVDEQGRREVMDVMSDALTRLGEIKERCAGRMALPSDGAAPMIAYMVAFESAAGARRRKPGGPGSAGERG
jgi:DNA-binding MarR family transcriptional regulator